MTILTNRPIHDIQTYYHAPLPRLAALTDPRVHRNFRRRLQTARAPPIQEDRQHPLRKWSGRITSSAIWTSDYDLRLPRNGPAVTIYLHGPAAVMVTLPSILIASIPIVEQVGFPRPRSQQGSNDMVTLCQLSIRNQRPIFVRWGRVRVTMVENMSVVGYKLEARPGPPKPQTAMNWIYMKQALTVRFTTESPC